MEAFSLWAGSAFAQIDCSFNPKSSIAFDEELEHAATIAAK